MMETDSGVHQSDTDDTVLFLNYCGIKTFTNEQLASPHLQKITCLYLKRNLLRTLPSGLKQLASLVQLHIAENELESLPSEIGSLSLLEVLDVGGNNLTSLPTTIGQLRSLRKLKVPNNQIQHVPLEIGQLDNLHTLEMSRNQLTAIPIELSRCTKLTLLALDRNRLRSFPRQLCRLHNLFELSLCGNNLEYLPQGIGGMERLSELMVDDNPALSCFPWNFDEEKYQLVGYHGCFQKGARLNKHYHHVNIKGMHVTVPEEIEEICVPVQNCVPCLKEFALRQLSSSLDDQDELKQNLPLPNDLKNIILCPTGQCVGCHGDIFCSAFPTVFQHNQLSKKNILMLGLCCSMKCVQRNINPLGSHVVYPYDSA